MSPPPLEDACEGYGESYGEDYDADSSEVSPDCRSMGPGWPDLLDVGTEESATPTGDDAESAIPTGGPLQLSHVTHRGCSELIEAQRLSNFLDCVLEVEAIRLQAPNLSGAEAALPRIRQIAGHLVREALRAAESRQMATQLVASAVRTVESRQLATQIVAAAVATVRSRLHAPAAEVTAVEALEVVVCSDAPLIGLPLPSADPVLGNMEDELVGNPSLLELSSSMVQEGGNDGSLAATLLLSPRAEGGHGPQLSGLDEQATADEELTLISPLGSCHIIGLAPAGDSPDQELAEALDQVRAASQGLHSAFSSVRGVLEGALTETAVLEAAGSTFSTLGRCVGSADGGASGSNSEQEAPTIKSFPPRSPSPPCDSDETRSAAVRPTPAEGCLEADADRLQSPPGLNTESLAYSSTGGFSHHGEEEAKFAAAVKAGAAMGVSDFLADLEEEFLHGSGAGVGPGLYHEVDDHEFFISAGAGGLGLLDDEDFATPSLGVDKEDEDLAAATLLAYLGPHRAAALAVVEAEVACVSEEAPDAFSRDLAPPEPAAPAVEETIEAKQVLMDIELGRREADAARREEEILHSQLVQQRMEAEFRAQMQAKEVVMHCVLKAVLSVQLRPKPAEAEVDVPEEEPVFITAEAIEPSAGIEGRSLDASEDPSETQEASELQDSESVPAPPAASEAQSQAPAEASMTQKGSKPQRPPSKARPPGGRVPTLPPGPPPRERRPAPGLQDASQGSEAKLRSPRPARRAVSKAGSSDARAASKAAPKSPAAGKEQAPQPAAEVEPLPASAESPSEEIDEARQDQQEDAQEGAWAWSEDQGFGQDLVDGDEGAEAGEAAQDWAEAMGQPQHLEGGEVPDDQLYCEVSDAEFQLMLDAGVLSQASYASYFPPTVMAFASAPHELPMQQAFETGSFSFNDAYGGSFAERGMPQPAKEEEYEYEDDPCWSEQAASHLGYEYDPSAASTGYSQGGHFHAFGSSPVVPEAAERSSSLPMRPPESSASIAKGLASRLAAASHAEGSTAEAEPTSQKKKKPVAPKAPAPSVSRPLRSGALTERSSAARAKPNAGSCGNLFFLPLDGLQPSKKEDVEEARLDAGSEDGAEEDEKAPLPQQPPAPDGNATGPGPWALLGGPEMKVKEKGKAVEGLAGSALHTARALRGREKADGPRASSMSPRVPDGAQSCAMPPIVLPAGQRPLKAPRKPKAVETLPGLQPEPKEPRRSGLRTPRG